ncbi:histidine ammonia-lyase [Rhodanobacter thiooxydans]|uniref:Histidine ammonia-lyase n=1 Tax=Rhodanobacter thiooxydans TaxID=416169 RepID=A0A154QEB4_9GAMM|nr:aromatic amino acid ammonia-lyase [Rhodanobacter thiooxydans]EIL99982.1 histidine ammonia-lyase [Rhodanobacter thiooxydans LCS2]KZC21939.1 histidine ammonia-lyase [Rhodanobacter thiooxydans]MCW0202980.1 aromatic amino acid lyase [Rhodanobacter thiooxydans]
MTAVGETILLDGSSLTRAQLVAVARQGASVVLDQAQLKHVQRAADFLADKVSCGEPTYGVTTGFGSNADKLLGAHRVRDELPGSQPAEGTLMEELQHNLIITHAVCVGKPFAADVVRAMLLIRINTLMRGHSGIRVSTLEALAAMLNAGVVPVVPEKGSVGASGDLAPLSHLAIVLLGGGEAFWQGERLSGAEALRRAGLVPIRLSFKEGLALNNGTAQMLATAALALDALEHLLDTADLAAAMTLDAFAGRSGALRADVHALRPHPGQVETAAHVRKLLDDSTLLDIPYHLVPRFKPWSAEAWSEADDQALSFDIGWDWVPANQRHGREAFYARFLPFKGGKKHQPQDAYSLRCMPQVHGAVRDAWAQACRVIDIELNSVTDNPLIFPDNGDAQFIEEQVISAGHFHGMPLALAMSYVKAAIPVLASISERRLNKLVDPATNDGLPAFLTGNEDGTDSGFMIVQYTAAALVNDLATRAHPASVYSVPTSANAEDHVSMGANEARHVLDMMEDLGHVLALELYTAAQALDYRQEMLNAARRLATRGGWQALAAKIANAPREGQPHYTQFVAEVQQLAAALAGAGDFHAGASVREAHAILRRHIGFMHRDRAMDGDVRMVCALVQQGALHPAA